MSSDTKYFNSSRLMSASGKNKTSNIARLDKKRVQAEKKHKVRQEISDIPQTQTLPNGGKPDFGHSSSRRKKKHGHSEKRSSSSGSKPNESGETDRLTKDLKELFIKPQNDQTRVGEIDYIKNDNKARETNLGSRSSSGTSSQTLSPSMSANSPPKAPFMGGGPLGPMPENHLNSALGASPLMMHPGLYPVPHPSTPQQQPHFAAFGYPYGNYSLSTGVAPQFMNPQTPLVNPMYPQPPLSQLPMMYKALDIQQQQQQHPQQNNNQYQHQQVHHIPQSQQQLSQSLPYLVPPMSSYPKSSETTAVKPLSRPDKPKTNYNHRNKTSTTFAGASFASSDPNVHKLPKPSFTKA